MEGKNTILWVLVGVVAVWIFLKRSGGYALAAPDAYYGAGTPVVPGTTRPAQAAQFYVLAPTGATNGPAVAARTGRGHF